MKLERILNIYSVKQLKDFNIIYMHLNGKNLFCE